jgi:hypothetical protein
VLDDYRWPLLPERQQTGVLLVDIPGLNTATDVVISGCSAGNLFTVFICVISPLCEQFV